MFAPKKSNLQQSQNDTKQNQTTFVCQKCASAVFFSSPERPSSDCRVECVCVRVRTHARTRAHTRNFLPSVLLGNTLVGGTPRGGERGRTKALHKHKRNDTRSDVAQVTCLSEVFLFRARK